MRCLDQWHSDRSREPLRRPTDPARRVFIRAVHGKQYRMSNPAPGGEIGDGPGTRTPNLVIKRSAPSLTTQERCLSLKYRCWTNNWRYRPILTGSKFNPRSRQWHQNWHHHLTIQYIWLNQNDRCLLVSFYNIFSCNLNCLFWRLTSQYAETFALY